MNIKCKKCDTTFEFSIKNSEATNIKFKCSVCGNIWNWENKKPNISKEFFNKKASYLIKTECFSIF